MIEDTIKHSKTKPTGISHDKGSHKSPFRARWFNPQTRKIEYIGRYKTREEAVIAREKYIKNKESLNGGEEQGRGVRVLSNGSSNTLSS